MLYSVAALFAVIKSEANHDATWRLESSQSNSLYMYVEPSGPRENLTHTAGLLKKRDGIAHNASW